MPERMKRNEEPYAAGEMPAEDGNKNRGKNSRRRAVLLGGALALCLAVGCLTGTVYFLAGNAGIMGREMRRLALPEETGLPAEEYPGMADHITAYLTGRKESFQYTFRTAEGTEILCFHEYEAAHMADCRNLIRLDGIVCAVCLGMILPLAAGLISAGKGNLPAAAEGAMKALGLLGLTAAGLALWAAVNFDGLFITFHRLAFRNDLWLLNPRTDLLIRLMPQPLFVRLGAEGLCIFTGEMLLFTAAAGWLKHRGGKKSAGRKKLKE